MFGGRSVITLEIFLLSMFSTTSSLGFYDPIPRLFFSGLSFLNLLSSALFWIFFKVESSDPFAPIFSLYTLSLSNFSYSFGFNWDDLQYVFLVHSFSLFEASDFHFQLTLSSFMYVQKFRLNICNSYNPH